MGGDESRVDIFKCISTRSGRASQNIAPFGHFIGKHNRKSVFAILDHMRSVDMIIMKIIQQKIAIGIRTDHAGHGSDAA